MYWYNNFYLSGFSCYILTNYFPGCVPGYRKARIWRVNCYLDSFPPDFRTLLFKEFYLLFIIRTNICECMFINLKITWNKSVFQLQLTERIKATLLLATSPEHNPLSVLGFLILLLLLPRVAWISPELNFWTSTVICFKFCWRAWQVRLDMVNLKKSNLHSRSIFQRWALYMNWVSEFQLPL